MGEHSVQRQTYLLMRKGFLNPVSTLIQIRSYKGWRIVAIFVGVGKERRKGGKGIVKMMTVKLPTTFAQLPAAAHQHLFFQSFISQNHPKINTVCDNILLVHLACMDVIIIIVVILPSICKGTELRDHQQFGESANISIE